MGSLTTQQTKLQDAMKKPDYESKVPENVRKTNSEKVRSGSICTPYGSEIQGKCITHRPKDDPMGFKRVIETKNNYGNCTHEWACACGQWLTLLWQVEINLNVINGSS